VRRREFLTTTTAALAACSSNKDRPTNLLFVLTDDQAPHTLSAYGNPEIRTPNSDKLGRGGALMQNSFCTTPVCSPSRMTLMTGQIPSQHQVHDWISDENEGEKSLRFLDGQPTLSAELAKAGYRCGLSGKWHMGDSATPQAGFDYWFAMPTGGSRYQDPEMYFQGEKNVYPGYATDVITDKALEFIEQSQDEPFFAFVAYNAPHTPYSGTPQKYLDIYRDSEFRTFPGEPLNEPIAHALSKQNVGNRDSKIHYYGMVTAIDDNVGRLAAKIEDLGLSENTLIVYLSDHGFLLEDHGLWGKGNTSWPYNMYDGSMLVPAYFYHQGRIAPGQRPTLSTSFYDFAPTILDYLGLPPMQSAKPLAGRSYASSLTGGGPENWDDTVYGEYQYCRMVREPEWKLIHRTEGFYSELYDLSNDPDERKNLFDDPAAAGQRERLETKLNAWFGALGCEDRDVWKNARQKTLPSYRRVTNTPPA
jgi:arylsulfatase A-like enzyme